MYSILFEDSEFKILQTKDIVLVRKNKPYECHSHFKHTDGAMLILKLFYKRVKPYEPFFIEAMRRITTSQEFNSFREQSKKYKYKNNSKRGR